MRLTLFELHKLAASRVGSILFVGYWCVCLIIFVDARFFEPRGATTPTWTEVFALVVLRPAPLAIIIALAAVAIWQGEDQSLGICRQTICLGFSRIKVIRAKLLGVYGGLALLLLGQVVCGSLLLDWGGGTAAAPGSVVLGLKLVAHVQLQLWCFGALALVAAVTSGSATAALLGAFGYVFLVEPVLQVVLLRSSLTEFVAFLPVHAFRALVPREGALNVTMVPDMPAATTGTPVIVAIVCLSALTAAAAHLLRRKDL
jgi:hypothetical protein